MKSKDLSKVLKEIGVLYGVKPEETIVTYNKLQNEVLREMASEKGYGSLFLNPVIHERTAEKVYNFYEKKFNAEGEKAE